MRVISLVIFSCFIHAAWSQSIQLDDICVDPIYDTSQFEASNIDTSSSLVYMNGFQIGLKQFIDLQFKKNELYIDSSFVHCDTVDCILLIYVRINMPLYINDESIRNKDEQSYVLSTLKPEDVISIERKSVPIAMLKYLKFIVK